MSFILDSVLEIGKDIVGGVTDHFKGKRKLKEAKVEAKLNRLKSAQIHDQEWEIKSLEDNGWKDDILFYAILGMLIWTGAYPEQATEFYNNLSIAPDWIIKTWFWLIASILGVKKIGDYGSKAVREIKNTIKK